jgi:hypothetical protein
VAAYCRVSTDSDEQATSYETQIEHYTTYITIIRTGNWPESMLMMGYPVPIPKSGMNLTA